MTRNFVSRPAILILLVRLDRPCLSFALGIRDTTPSVPCLSLPWLDMLGDTHTNGQPTCHHPVANLVVSTLAWEGCTGKPREGLFSPSPSLLARRAGGRAEAHGLFEMSLLPCSAVCCHLPNCVRRPVKIPSPLKRGAECYTRPGTLELILIDYAHYSTPFSPPPVRTVPPPRHHFLLLPPPLYTVRLHRPQSQTGFLGKNNAEADRSPTLLCDPPDQP